MNINFNKFPVPSDVDKFNEYIEFILNYEEPASDELIEIHHITPRCLGGTDDKENLIKLKIRDHYYVHLLLAQAFKQFRGLAVASMLMSSGVSTSEEYEVSRSLFLEHQKEVASTRNKLWCSMYKGEDEEICVKRSDIELYTSQGYQIGMSPAHRRKLGDSHRGLIHSEESNRKKSESNKGKNLGKIWVNNGKIQKTVYEHELENLTGFVRGRLPFSDSHKKNLSEQKRLYMSEHPEYKDSVTHSLVSYNRENRWNI